MARRWLLLSTLWLLVHAAVAARTADAAVWKTSRPHKAVIIGGSITQFFGGNFGQYLQAGCRQLEVVNRGEVGAGGPKLLKNLREHVLGDSAVRKGVTWVLFNGGLNSIGAVDTTIWATSRLMAEAHAAGLKVMALSLTPWGSDAEARFDGWSGLRLVRNTAMTVDYLFNRLTPQAALGARLASRTGDPQQWSPAELPDIAVDLFHSPLRAGDAVPLRPRGPLESSFASGPFRKRSAERDTLIEAARAVPRHFLKKEYHSFDAIHPNTQGHRLMAVLACQQAPPEWGCDCDAIRRATWKGKVVLGQ